MGTGNATRRERRVKQRQERDDLNRAQHDIFTRRQRNKRFLNIAIACVLGVLILWGLARIVTPDKEGVYDGLAQCLTRAGVTMYGTDWCPHCQDQKALFGPSFRYVQYVNCDANRPACDAAGVTGFPTWVFPDGGESLAGEQPLATLAARAGCAFADQP